MPLTTDQKIGGSNPSGITNKSKTCVIFINQLREKVGVMYGNPETTTGGRALKFYASVRLDVRKTESLKQGGDVYGNKVKVKIVKNKVAPPFKVAEFEIIYGKGISKQGELVDLGVKFGILQKSGAWFSYGDMRLGQGRDKTRELFYDNPELAAEIEAKIFESIRADREAKAEKPQPVPHADQDIPEAQPTTRRVARAKLDIVVDDDE